MELDLEEVRQRLIEMRADLVHEDALGAADRAPVTLDQESVGRLSRMDAMQVQAMAMAQQQRRNMLKNQIDAALNRIDAGEYGYCITCGENIAEARLLHSPAAPTCIACAQGTG